MKNILYIVSTLTNSGPINQLYNLIKYLDRNTYRPFIVTLSHETENSVRDEFEKIDVCLYSLNLSRIIGFLIAQKKIEHLIDEIKPIIIHSQGIRGDIISSKIKKIVPKITTVHNMLQLDYTMTYGKLIGIMMYIRHSKSFINMSLCIGVSGAVGDNLKRKFNVSSNITIYNGVNTDSFYTNSILNKEGTKYCYLISIEEKILLRKKLNLPINDKIWITSGSLTSRKDPLFLINNWIKIQKIKDVEHLVLIGDGVIKERCKNIAMGSDSIHIIGHVNNVADYLCAADYYVSSSQAEGFPLAVLEAMACGLPVLLSDIGPHKEIMTLAPEAGLLYKLKNESDFTESLNKMMQADKNKMSVASLEVIKNTLNARTMSEKYQKVYNLIINNRM